MNMDPNYRYALGNYGLQQIRVDPARPSDLYAFTNYQGVWKSIDYGVTWTKIDTGANSDAIDAGRNWSSAIDPNPARNPATPPTIFTEAGYSLLNDSRRLGMWKSTDGGVNWTFVWNTILAPNGTNISNLVGADISGVVTDPTNIQHLLTQSHGNSQGYDYHYFETTNGGVTWIDKGFPSGGGFSAQTGACHYALNFINATTWIATCDGWGTGSTGSFVTNNSGASWTHIGQYGAPHGSTQAYVDSNGTAYLPAMGGIYKATSPYVSWTQLDGGDTSVVVGTPNFLYASFGWAYQGPVSPSLRRASHAAGTPWDSNYTATPPAMANGMMGAAVTNAVQSPN
jgi:hypothetical protein